MLDLENSESPTTTNKNNKSNGVSPHGETETENTGSKKPWSTDAIDWIFLRE